MTPADGTISVQQFEPLRRQFVPNASTPVTLPPGRVRLATRPSLTGSAAGAKTIGIVGGRRFGRAATAVPPCSNHGDLRRDQFGRQRRQSIVLPSAQRYSIATLLALDIAQFAQAAGEMRRRSSRPIGRWPR